MAISGGSAVLQIWLGRTERALRSRLDEGDMPFLGLYTDQFSAQHRQYFRDNAISPDRPVGSFVRGLEKWPATFAIYLTIHVVEGYGRSGDAAVYPFICDALGISGRVLTVTERDKLWLAYRKACVTLGLSVLPTQSDHNLMVREYLHQAGAPMRFLGGLIDRFANLSQKYGCPDADDPEALQVWGEQLDVSLLQKPVQRAIETDQSAYYARLFLRVRPFETEDNCSTDLERLAFRTIRDAGHGQTFSKSMVPEVQWREGEIGVLLPPGSDKHWSIRISEHGGEAITLPSIAGDEDPRFVPCQAALPHTIEVAATNLYFKLVIWETAADNQLLVFNRSGRLRCRAKLGGLDVNLDPGHYTLLLRWAPAELADMAYPIPNAVGLYESVLELAAAQSLELRRGPAGLVIHGRPIPSIEWVGKRFVGMTGREIYASDELAVRLSIPQDIIDAATQGLELVVRHSSSEETRLPLPDVQSAGTEILLSEMFSHFGLGLGKVMIRLRRPDIPNRSLASVSSLVWNGLHSAAEGTFRCVSPQAFTNLDQQYSENIKIDGSTLTYADDEQRYFRTVFNLSSGEAVAHKWLVPGIFLILEEPASTGGPATERPIARGSILQVRLSSRQRLKIYSSYEGTLTLGSFHRDFHSALLGGTQLYLSTLVEHLSPENQTLRLRLPTTAHEVDLVRLVTPHQVVSFESRRSGDEYVLIFSIPGHLQQLQIRAEEVINGAAEELAVLPDTIAVSGAAFAKASLTTAERDHRTHAELRLPLTDWALGAWVFHLQVKIDGRWGKLVNQRGDVYAGAMLLGPMATQITAFLEDAPISQRLEVFGRLVDLSLECYSLESWHDLSWLDKEWDALATAIEPVSTEHVGQLLGLALREVPETASDSWVPLKSVSARFLALFALPIDAYAGLPAGSSVTKALLGRGDRISGDDSTVFHGHFLDSLLIFGFRNGARLARTWGIAESVAASEEQLRHFDIRNYINLTTFVPESERRRVLANSDWVPTPGDYLGLRHYWWALKRLTEHLHSAQAGNDQRKGNALRLASRVATSRAAGVHPHLSESHLASTTSLGLMSSTTSDESLDQDSNNIADLVDLISVLAYVVRLEIRQPGILRESSGKLLQTMKTDQRHLESVLGFVLYIGLDLFIFYLVLWEFVMQRDLDRGR